jgi:U3 small nucleolar RNA-associated protein 21
MGSVTGPVWSNSKNVSAEESGMTGWESVITAHADDKVARTWSWGRKKAGRWAFETGDHKPVTSVAITACGTFAIVGSSGGSLDMFNLQSGAHRQRYPPRLTPAQAKQLKQQQADPEHVAAGARGHRAAITGVVVDNLNQTMVTASLDGMIIFWDFSSGKILERKSFDDATPTAIRYNPVSGLLAISCDDLCIRVIDIETRKVVRELWGCIGQIYDYCFSHDGRWIVAGSMDSVVRVFDLATGHLIDAFKTAATCTNMAFSSTGEFLATTHAGNPGIFVWTNKALFTHVSTRRIDDVKGIIDLSQTPAAFNAASQLAIEESGLADEAEETLVDGIQMSSELDQLDKSLLTLSLQPQSRWQTLLNLDSIRARNKPIQPPEKLKAAPFFLGTSASLANGGDIPATNGPDTKAVDEAERSRVSRMAVSSASSASELSSLLGKFSQDAERDPTALATYLSALPPSAADLEIRSIALSEMPVFVSFLTAQLGAKTSFELVNTWMNVLLRVHGDFVAEVDEVRRAVMAWRDVMLAEERRLAELVGYSRGVVEFLRSAR